MRAVRVLPVVMSLLASAGAMADTSPTPPMPATLSVDECAVWKRELSFAQSVADHDAAAFADHVGEQAAFGSGTPTPTRGREAIVRQWTGLIDGKGMRLRWYPTRVTIAGVGDVAWSSGPALFEDTGPHPTIRYHLGAFHSVWHKDADGVWRVLFDDGVQPRPATKDEVRAFELGRAECGTATGA